ncbi:NADH-ubiquinone oxidoreductase chain 4L [Manis javanica]|nr:NADH-ubiquinone oxidoreductase chain 4L [Manis javanica]
MSRRHDSIFIVLTVTILNTHFTPANMVPIILLIFTGRETALGLSLLVLVSHTYSTDYV